jgi:hypothetical protein
MISLGHAQARSHFAAYPSGKIFVQELAHFLAKFVQINLSWHYMTFREAFRHIWHTPRSSTADFFNANPVSAASDCNLPATVSSLISDT